MEKVRTKINEKWVDKQGILWMKVIEGAHIDLPSLKEDTAINETLTNGKKPLVLYDARNFFTITPEAREYLQSGILNKSRLATAVVSENFRSRLVINFIMLMKKPKSPLKMFENEKKALEWLEKFRN